MTPVCRAAAAHTPTSETLQAARRQATRAGDHELTHVFAPEIAALDDDQRDATVDAPVRPDQLGGLGRVCAPGDGRVEASREAMRQSLVVMLGPYA